MKKVLILNNAYYRLDSYLNQSKRLAEEFEKMGVQATVRANDFFPALLDGERAVSDLDCDFIVYFDKDKYASELLEKCGYRLFNRHKSVLLCDDKMATYIALEKSGVHFPKTLPAPLCYIGGQTVLPQTLDKVEQELDYPVVVKQSYGSLGKGVFLAKNKQELVGLANRLICTPHHFQQYIKSSHGMDIRVIVIGGKAVCAMLRKSNGDFRSNVELGGIGQKMELSAPFKQTAELCAKTLELDYCGVDLLIDKNGNPLVCEVNSNAFFGGIEKVTGVNVAKAYVEYMLDCFYK